MSNQIVRAETVDLSALSSQETGFSISDFKQIIYRRWKPALAVGITAFTGLFLYTALQTPEYSSETLILLETPKTKDSASIAPTGKLIPNPYYSSQDMSTEMFILRSNSTIDKAIDTLRHKYPDLSTANVVENLLMYQASVNRVATDVLVVNYTDSDPERAKAVLEVLSESYIKYSLDKQRSQINNTLQFINSQIPKAKQELNDAAIAVRRFRQVHQVVDPNSSAIDAQNAKQSLAKQIRETEIAIKLKETQSHEIGQQLSQLGQDSEIMIASSVLGQDGVYQDLARELHEIETQYNIGQLEFHDNYHVMESLKERQAELKRLLRERAKQILGDSSTPELLERIILVRDSKAKTTPIPNPNSSILPSDTTNLTIKESQSETSSHGSILGDFAEQQLRLKQELVALKTQLNNLRTSKIEAENHFDSIPHLQQTFMELERKLKLKSEAYNYLLEKKQELEIAEAEESAPWRILNPPFLPNKPISPNMQTGLLKALLAGGALGVATAFLLQQLDQRIKQVEEIKKLARLPLLGVVPKVSNPRIDINIHTTRKSYSYYSSFTEGLRALGMNLRYLTIETGRIKSLAITSSTSAEGKSTITHNLGIVLTEFNLRVLIVDADMRKPKMHKLTELPNEEGLSNAIAEDRPWTEIVQSSGVENLDVITAGATAPNPIALLNSNKMKQLLEEWQEAYDYILIDTPPVGVIADAKSIASEVDSILFVAGIQRVSRKALQNALDVLHNSQCNLAGVVANMVDPEFDYYAYSYYDSYYNQPSRNDEDSNASDSRIDNILQQFRRR